MRPPTSLTVLRRCLARYVDVARTCTQDTCTSITTLTILQLFYGERRSYTMTFIKQKSSCKWRTQVSHRVDHTIALVQFLVPTVTLHAERAQAHVTSQPLRRRHNKFIACMRTFLAMFFFLLTHRSGELVNEVNKRPTVCR